MAPWTEKHRPQTLDDLIGNADAIRSLRRWAQQWARGRPEKKAVVFDGDPGLGKTSAALALANDMGWEPVEMNASDQRNAEAVRRVATRGALAETFSDAGAFRRRDEGGRKLIILDEADNVFGREDFGGVAAIAETIRRTRHPIILIVNDAYELTRRSSTFKTLCRTIRFRPPSENDVATVLRRVAQREGVHLSDEALSALARRGRDLRSAINDLESLAEGRSSVEIANVEALGYRDARSEVPEALRRIFSVPRPSEARAVMSELDESPEDFLLWVDENLPYEYRRPEELAAGLHALSRADIFLGRVKRRQHFGFWSYAIDHMTAGVAAARHGQAGGAYGYRFPQWLMKMGRSRGVRNVVASLAGKVGRHCHVSRRVAAQELLPGFGELFRADASFRVAMVRELGLDEKEVAFLLRAEEDSHLVRDLMQEATREGAPEPLKPLVEGGEGEKEPQRSLFEY